MAAVLLVLAALVADMSGPSVLSGSALAQSQGNVPGETLGNSSDAEIWRMLRRGHQGTVSLPDKGAGVMIQSEGDNWRAIRNGPVSVIGGWLLLAAILVLGAFYAVRGRIRIEGGFSGRTVVRFSELERFAHWVTASSFVLLGLTGLNMLYGRYVIKPLIGPEAFATLTSAGKYTHNFIAFAFMVGIILMAVLWVRDNLPKAGDWEWIKKGGGMFTRGGHGPPAGKFNAGQKIMFWLVILSGLSLSFTGLGLLFPFAIEPFGATYSVLSFVGFDLPTDLSPTHEMQLTQLWHAILALLMIAVILAHIYIGWIGMEGAFDAMGTGSVDENWAREHHSLWAAEIGAGGAREPPAEASGE